MNADVVTFDDIWRRVRNVLKGGMAFLTMCARCTWCETCSGKSESQCWTGPKRMTLVAEHCKP